MGEFILFYYFIVFMIGVIALGKCYIFYLKTKIEYIKSCILFLFVFKHYIIVGFFEAYIIAYLKAFEIELMLYWLSNFSIKILFLGLVIFINNINKVKGRKYINLFFLFLSIINFFIDYYTVGIDTTKGVMVFKENNIFVRIIYALFYIYAISASIFLKKEELIEEKEKK